MIIDGRASILKSKTARKADNTKLKSQIGL